MSRISCLISLSVNMAESTKKKRDRTNENFRKAVEGIMRRGDKISQGYGADVYILLRRRNRHFEYTSVDKPSWPTSKPEIVSILSYFSLGD